MKIPLNPAEINKIRAFYPADCLDAADVVTRLIPDYLQAIITLINLDKMESNQILIYDSLSKKWNRFYYHAVVATRDGIIDILNTDDIIPIEKYITKLKTKNRFLDINPSLCYGNTLAYPMLSNLNNWP